MPRIVYQLSLLFALKFKSSIENTGQSDANLSIGNLENTGKNE